MVTMKPACVSGLFLFFWSGATAQLRPDTIISRHQLEKVSLLPCTPVRNQYMSGTCWSYASQSFLQSELIRKEKNPDDLSEMFLVRHSWWHKIRLRRPRAGATALRRVDSFVLMEENYFGFKTAALIVSRESSPLEIRNRLKE